MAELRDNAITESVARMKPNTTSAPLEQPRTASQQDDPPAPSANDKGDEERPAES